VNEESRPGVPDERTALGMLLSQQPRLELREQRFPVRQIVLAVIFGDAGETTIPITVDAARLFAVDLVELADKFEAEGSGEQN
jgi:hypothetical protein